MVMAPIGPWPPNPWSQRIAHIGICSVFALLCTGAALGLIHTVSDVADLLTDTQGLRSLAYLILAIFTATGTLSAAWWLARRDEPVPPRLFLCGLIVATIAVRSILITTVDPAWSTDYLRYWERAVQMAASDELLISDVYRQRALLVAYPVELLFGPEATTALKWANAFLLLIVQLALYDMMRLSVNHQAAQASSLVLLASPLPAYAALIPSHDVWGMLFLAGALWAVARARRLPHSVPGLAWVAIWGSVCALSAYLFELQRSIGTLFCLALVAASLLDFFANRGRHSGQRFSPALLGLLVSAIALVSQPMLASVGARLDVHPATQERYAIPDAMKRAAHGSAMGTARSAWFARFNDRFRAQTERDRTEVQEFSRSVYLSTWALQPLGKLDAMREHGQRLFSLSYPTDWDTILRRPEGMSPQVRSGLVAHIGIFGVSLLIAVLICGLLMCLRRPGPAFPALAGTTFATGLALALLLVFENKPYNIAAVWLIYPIIFGGTFASIGPRSELQPRGALASSASHAVKGFGALAVTAIALLLLLRASYGIDDGRVIDGWEISLDQAGETNFSLAHDTDPLLPRAFDPDHYIHDTRDFVLRDALEDGPRIQRRADRLYLALRFPDGPLVRGDRLTASRELCTEGRRGGFEFFMFAPYLRRDVNQAFTVEVAVDGNVLDSLPIPHANRSDSMRLVSVRGLPRMQGCPTLSVSLVSHVDRTALSWARASHVELWFPRLVP